MIISKKRVKSNQLGSKERSIIIFVVIRVIPQGTVDNNLGPDQRSKGSGSKLLQTTTIVRPLFEVLTVYGMSFACFGPIQFPYSYYSCRASDRAAVVTTFKDFSYDAVISPSPGGCITCYASYEGFCLLLPVCCM